MTKSTLAKKSRAACVQKRALCGAPHVSWAGELRKTFESRNAAFATAVIALRAMELVLVCINLMIPDANLQRGN